MSDLYLVLRHRLDDITDWVMIDTDVLRTARLRVGLSYEAVARHLHVSSKTYERYEKRGRLPRALVSTVATLFELQIEAGLPPPPRVADTWTSTDDLAAEILARLEKALRAAKAGDNLTVQLRPANTTIVLIATSLTLVAFLCYRWWHGKSAAGTDQAEGRSG